MKKAIITGITGQDGAYLADFLLKKGYEVHGIKRRSSLINTQRIDHLYEDPQTPNRHLHLHYGDLTDSTNLTRIIQEVQPDEIYNLAAMSHVHVSFEEPEYTANADGIGTLRILEAVRLLGLYAYWITVNYREAYNMFACNGILFNHESPQRGETFVTRKITRATAKIALGMDSCIYLGNLDAKRDWGHAKDYIEGMYLILQQEKPEDFVLATGITTTIRDFVKMSFAELGIELGFRGKDEAEVGYVLKNTGEYKLEEGQVVVKVDPKYYRPTEVDLLIGDPTKAMTKLGWKPKYDLAALVKEMVASDIALTKKNLIK